MAGKMCFLSFYSIQKTIIFCHVLLGFYYFFFRFFNVLNTPDCVCVRFELNVINVYAKHSFKKAILITIEFRRNLDLNFKSEPINEWYIGA